ncbi:juvenile hormone esterase-like [Arctopsyche grandis]|uniref:juvenile hormone esterase-like n=1 Tax=Arctopsyche grandis TaxID=121162 RepID=UPI00406D8451
MRSRHYHYTSPLNEQGTKIEKLVVERPVDKLIIKLTIIGINGPYLHINSISYIPIHTYVFLDFVSKEYKITSIEAGSIFDHFKYYKLSPHREYKASFIVQDTQDIFHREHHSLNMKLLLILLYLMVPGLVYGIRLIIPELGAIEGSTTVSAWTNRSIHQFLGVKFGQTTSGTRRFMPPEPTGPWQGVYDATTEGVECPHLRNLPMIINTPPNVDAEDCLLLNLYTPIILDKNTKVLPVMVFFHGGGFYEGSARLYPPNYLLEHDVVLVVVQYRLGPLGFMSLDTDGISGNVGLMDQVIGLKWVHKYIRNFGGDNTRVTIFGQSAGGCSVSLHLISPMVDSNLFQQAIIMSGSSHANWAFDTNPTVYAKSLYSVLRNTTVKASNPEMEDVFKNVSIIEFMKAVYRQSKMYPEIRGGRVVFQKAGLIKYLTESPENMINKGNYRTVPMMAGVVKNDGAFFTAVLYNKMEIKNLLRDDYFMRNNLTHSLFESAGIRDTTNILIDTFNNIYFKELFDMEEKITFADVAPGITDILGNMLFKLPTMKQAKINARYENRTYFYTLDYRGEHTRFGHGADTTKYTFDGGVHHSNDLLYLFPYHYTSPLNEQDTKIAKLVVGLWTSFAINGKPTSSLLNVEWPILKKSRNGPYLHINSIPYISQDFINEEYKITSRATTPSTIPEERVHRLIVKEQNPTVMSSGNQDTYPERS